MPQADDLLSLGLWMAGRGLNAALGLLGLGVLVMMLGQRAFRPVAALLAGAGGAFAASLALSKWWPSAPLNPGLLVATVAVLFGVLGIASPTFATVLAAVCFGWLGADAFSQLYPAHSDLALLVGVVGSCVLSSILATFLPRFVTAIAGGLAAGLGAWAAVGASGLSPTIFRVPALWLALTGVLVVVAVALEQSRHRAEEAGASRRRSKLAEKARKQKEAEDRARYEKYMQ